MTTQPYKIRTSNRRQYAHNTHACEQKRNYNVHRTHRHVLTTHNRSAQHLCKCLLLLAATIALCCEVILKFTGPWRESNQTQRNNVRSHPFPVRFSHDIALKHIGCNSMCIDASAVNFAASIFLFFASTSPSCEIGVIEQDAKGERRLESSRTSTATCNERQLRPSA